MISHLDIRKARKEFRISKEHADTWSASLIPWSEDKTVMFNIAWMQPLVPYLMGKKHPQWDRVFNMQKCVRTVDIEEIGDERHLTFFEMMGNRSLNSYFKQESLTWSRDFLTQYCGLNPDKIGLTIFGGYTDESWKEIIPYDKEAEKIAIWLGISKERIKAIPMVSGEKCDNMRWPAGAIWPCGPSAEFHYDRGEERWPNDRDMGENDRFMEVRNNVFMNMYKNEEGEYSFMNNHNIDTGMWYERLMMVIQGTETIFETDIFSWFLQQVESITKKSYPPFTVKAADHNKEQQDITKRFRIITDHLRASSFLIGDGIMPSNEWRGYVLRRLVRRGYFHFQHLLPDGTSEWQIQAHIEQLIEHICSSYTDAYQEIRDNKSTIIHTILHEVKQFQKTLQKGKKQFDEILLHTSSNQISWEDVFTLYDTYGFPVDLTKELAEKEGKSIDEDGFHKAYKEAQQRSRQWAKNMFSKDIDRSKHIGSSIPATKFIWYEQLESEESTLIKDFEVEWQRVLIFDTTPFYAEWGGQIGDKGTILWKNGEKLVVTNVKKYDGVFLHFVE